MENKINQILKNQQTIFRYLLFGDNSPNGILAEACITRVNETNEILNKNKTKSKPKGN